MTSDSLSPIHSTALVAASAQLGANVKVGPFAIIEDGVTIGPRSQIGAHAVIRTGTRIGEQTIIDSHAVIGGAPQDLSFDLATASGVVIGNGVVIREGVTIHRSTQAGSDTVIGDKVFLMAAAHVAHDCQVEDEAILANAVLLAGYVKVERKAFLGGGAVFHQFVRIGESAMISGGARIAYDVPPYTMAAERSRMHGLNLIGLRRRQLGSDVISDLKKCYRYICSAEAGPRAMARKGIAEQIAQSEQGRHFLQFVEQSKRGIIRPGKSGELN